MLPGHDGCRRTASSGGQRHRLDSSPAGDAARQTMISPENTVSRNFTASIAIGLAAGGISAPADARAQSPGQPAGMVEVTISEGTNVAAALSPDERTLALDLLGRIWVMPASGGTATALTDPVGDARQPAWSPDGSRIAFQAYWDGNYHIWSVGADGTGLRQHTRGRFDHREPHWSPDGARLAFSSDRGGSYDVWVMELDGGDPERLTDWPGNEYGPRVLSGWPRDRLRCGRRPGRDLGDRKRRARGLGGKHRAAEGRARRWGPAQRARVERRRRDALLQLDRGRAFAPARGGRERGRAAYPHRRGRGCLSLPGVMDGRRRPLPYRGRAGALAPGRRQRPAGRCVLGDGCPRPDRLHASAPRPAGARPVSGAGHRLAGGVARRVAGGVFSAGRPLAAHHRRGG